MTPQLPLDFGLVAARWHAGSPAPRRPRPIARCCRQLTPGSAAHSTGDGATRTRPRRALWHGAVYLPEGKPKSVAMFLSGDGGWELGVINMARALPGWARW